MHREFLRLGIDLGASNSTICAMEGDCPRVIKVNGVDEAMASAVYIDRRGRVIVGTPAYRAMLANSPNEGDGYMGYKLRIGQDDQYDFHVAGVKKSARELASLLIGQLLRAYREDTGEDLPGCVITVPPQAEHSACEGTREAAMMAGIKFCPLIEEPVAAAVAHGFTASDRKAQLLVFDLGGSTLDISLVGVKDDQLCVSPEGCAGDHLWGGRNFDRKILAYVLQELKKQYALSGFQEDNPRYRQAFGRLLLACEEAKLQLSRRPEAVVETDGLLCEDDHGQQVKVEIPVTQTEYSRWIAPDVAKAVHLCRTVLERNRMKGSDLTKLILIGGPTKTPYVREALANGLGIEVETSINPMTAVAIGAAIYATTVEVPEEFRTTQGQTSAEPAVKLRLEYERTSEEAVVSGRPHASGHGPVSAPLYEDVQFTVFRPQLIAPERWYSLLAFAHLSDRRPGAPADEPDPLHEVLRQASHALGEQMQDYRPVTQDSTEAIPLEGKLTFLPEVPGIEFNPQRATLLWIESVHRQDFRLRARREMDGQTARGRISVFLGMRIVADVPLAIRVDAQLQCSPTAVPTETVSARPYRKVFASYSHKDTAVVDEFERILTASGDQYLRDSLTLRAGDIWSDRLAEMICEADIFQLFWSSNSMVSSFVRQEWEHALSLRREHFVRPVYWEEPLPENRSLGLPTDALRQLHFQSLRPRSGRGGTRQKKQDDRATQASYASRRMGDAPMESLKRPQVLASRSTSTDAPVESFERSQVLASRSMSTHAPVESFQRPQSHANSYDVKSRSDGIPHVLRRLTARERLAGHLSSCLQITSWFAFIVGGIVGYVVNGPIGCAVLLSAGWLLGIWIRRSLGQRGSDPCREHSGRIKERPDGSRRGVLEWVIETLRGSGPTVSKCKATTAAHEQTMVPCHSAESPAQKQAILQRLDEEVDLSRSFGNQANVLYAHGDLDGAMVLYKEQERICRCLGNLSGLSVSLGNQALILQDRGNIDGAMALLKEQERICRQLGNQHGLSVSFGNQAVILQDRGDLDGSMALHKEEERIWRQLGNLNGLQLSLGNQALILKDRGDLDGAMALHQQEEQICRQLGELNSLQRSLGNQGLILSDRGDLDGAMALHKEQERICRQLSDLDGLAKSLAGQGIVLCARGDLDGAMTLHKEHERICRQLGYLDGLQWSLGNQAFILKARGDLDGAMALDKEKERICRQLGRVDGLARSLVNQASTLQKMSHAREGLPLAEEAYRIASTHGYASLAKQIEPILNAVRQAAQKD